jgi:hypothetical protein
MYAVASPGSVAEALGMLTSAMAYLAAADAAQLAASEQADQRQRLRPVLLLPPPRSSSTSGAGPSS